MADRCLNKSPPAQIVTTSFVLSSFPDRHVGYRVHYPIKIYLSDGRHFRIGGGVTKIDRQRLTVADGELDRIQIVSKILV